MNFGGFLGWWVWLFIHIGFLTGYRNRVGAVLGWWFAFTRDLRRERTFTIDDMPRVGGVYGVVYVTTSRGHRRIADGRQRLIAVLPCE